MNSKAKLTIVVIATIAVGMTSATSLFGVDDALGKSCNHNGHCKGTHGWYYKGTHHHCFKGEKSCVNKSKHGYH